MPGKYTVSQATVRKKPHDKQEAILAAAAALFASRPFHEVRLEDVAARAKVGKGTVYLYWSSKEALYLALVRRGFAAVVERLHLELPGCEGRTWDEVRTVIRALIHFANDHPGVYRIMRSGGLTPEDPQLQHIRRTLTDVIHGVLLAGVKRGDLRDTEPALTTQYLLSFVRGVTLYGPAHVSTVDVERHMLELLRHGLSCKLGVRQARGRT